MPSLFRGMVIAILLATHSQAADSTTVASPAGNLVARFQLVDGTPHWQLSLDGRPCLQRGQLGLRIASKHLAQLETWSTNVTSHREVVNTVWGKAAEYDNHYRQLEWMLREASEPHRQLRIVVRVYDQGIALRYELPDDGGWEETVKLAGEDTEFSFCDDPTAWCYAGEHDPTGPLPLSRLHADPKLGPRLPLTVATGSGLHLAVLEAAIFNLAPLQLEPSDRNEFSFRARLAASTLSRGASTPWRVVLVGQTAGDLLVAPLMFCLNPPCQLASPTWIKPGLAMWDWRAWGAVADDGFAYGLDMPSWRRFIDFAARHGIAYLVLDAGWYGLEFEATSDPRTSRDYLLVQPNPDNPRLVARPAPPNWNDPIDIPELIRYGRSKNVGIILYINDVARQNYPFEETLALYHRWGAAGIKYGFMKGRGQAKTRETRKIVELCAKYELVCDFHDGPVPPSGDRRAFPNYLTREFCHSQSDARRAFSPTGFCEQVFVNMLAGPLDMCNGLYTLENPTKDRPKIFTNVNTTIVAETSRVLITFSGLSILPDAPHAYEARADLFQFLSGLPMTWDETRILHGKIGHFITTARRHQRDWFVASATNEQARALPIKLDFLEPGQSYRATLFEDAPDAHYVTKREAYRVRQMEVRHGDTIEARMAPGGGHCLHLEPLAGGE